MARVKQCTGCGQELPLFAFGNHSITKDGLNHWCKECSRERSRIRRLTPEGIYSALKSGQRYYQKKPVIVSKESFIDWYTSQPKQCVYCDLREEDIHKHNDPRNNKSARLTIDRMNNDEGYSIDNMVLACHRCNEIKTDFFSYEEMREIGQKFVKPKWVTLLKKHNHVQL